MTDGLLQPEAARGPALCPYGVEPTMKPLLAATDSRPPRYRYLRSDGRYNSCVRVAPHCNRGLVRWQDGEMARRPNLAEMTTSLDQMPLNYGSGSRQVRRALSAPGLAPMLVVCLSKRFATPSVTVSPAHSALAITTRLRFMIDERCATC